MIKILASNSDKIKPDGMAAIGPASLNPFADDKLVITSGFLSTLKIPMASISVDELDEEKSKSFLGAAGFGMVGAALLGPLGLVVGALAGGNKKTQVFGLTFNFEGFDYKLVVETSSKDDIKKFKNLVYKKMVA